MKLIVGLGNPGKEYEKNRHNIGFIIIDKYLKYKNINNFKEKFNSLYIKENINNEVIIFQKPLTYMNLSGNAIYEISKFFKIEPKDILIIHDDLDLKIGEVKIKTNGGSGGQNGIKSIIQNIGENFNRLKIGIDKPNEKNIISHVLGNFTKEEEDILNSIENKIFKIIDNYINGTDIDKIKSKFNIKINNKNKKIENKLRKAKLEDLNEIFEITKEAIEYQIENGNNQWNKNYPNINILKKDIEKNNAYVIENNKKIIAYAVLEYEKIKNYENIIEGNIDNNEKYSSIHRLMVSKKYMNKNIATTLLEKLIRISIRDGYFINLIDTKKENKAMLKVIEKIKYVYIAKIVLDEDNTERNVFEYRLGGK